ncbi:MAG: biotin/lipoyl-containing protein [Candidatus Nitrosocaldaceae archaeon]
MEFKLEDIGEIVNIDIIKRISSEVALVNINGKEYLLRIISYDGDKAEFILGNSYYNVKYIENTPTHMKIQIIGKESVTISKYPHLQKIIKSSSASLVDTEKMLRSPIPGRVVSIEAKPEMSVKKGDVIAILESMKMRVAIKAHKDGVIKELRIKEGGNISRNDAVALIE